jgi:hypothetical protein
MFWSLMDLIGFHYYWSGFLTAKTKRKTYLLSLAGLWLFPAAYTLIGLNADFGRIISFAVLTLVCFLNYRGPLLQKILLIILPYIFGVGLDTAALYGTGLLLGISVEALVWRKTTYALVVTGEKMIFLLLAWTVHYIRNRKKAEILRSKWLFLSLLFPVVSFTVLLMLYYEFRQQSELSMGLVVINVLLMVSNIAIIYLIRLMEKTRPGITCSAADDENLRKTFASQNA